MKSHLLQNVRKVHGSIEVSASIAFSEPHLYITSMCTKEILKLVERMHVGKKTQRHNNL